jgi:hypothetical protein
VQRAYASVAHDRSYKWFTNEISKRSVMSRDTRDDILCGYSYDYGSDEGNDGDRGGDEGDIDRITSVTNNMTIKMTAMTANMPI